MYILIQWPIHTDRLIKVATADVMSHTSTVQSAASFPASYTNTICTFFFEIA